MTQDSQGLESTRAPNNISPRDIEVDQYESGRWKHGPDPPYHNISSRVGFANTQAPRVHGTWIADKYCIGNQMGQEPGAPTQPGQPHTLKITKSSHLCYHKGWISCEKEII